jgi:hypothetical protein
MTDTELNVMAALAMMGLKSRAPPDNSAAVAAHFLG